MAKDLTVSQEMAEKFKTEKDTPYLRFVRQDGLDIISAQYVHLSNCDVECQDDACALSGRPLPPLLSTVSLSPSTKLIWPMDS